MWAENNRAPDVTRSYLFEWVREVRQYSVQYPRLLVFRTLLRREDGVFRLWLTDLEPDAPLLEVIALYEAMVWDGPTHLPLGEVAAALHRRVATALRNGDRILQNSIESCATQWFNLIPSPGRLFADAFTSTTDRKLVVQMLLFFVQYGCIKDFEDWKVE